MPWSCSSQYEENQVLRCCKGFPNTTAFGPKEIQAAWLGTCYDEINVGKNTLPLPMTLRLPFIPVTRTENFCASNTKAFRGAIYAVTSGL